MRKFRIHKVDPHAWAVCVYESDTLTCIDLPWAIKGSWEECMAYLHLQRWGQLVEEWYQA